MLLKTLVLGMCSRWSAGRGDEPQISHPRSPRTSDCSKALTPRSRRLKKRMIDAETLDDYPGRSSWPRSWSRCGRASRADHYEVANAKGRSRNVKALGTLPAEKRAGWRNARLDSPLHGV